MIRRTLTPAGLVALALMLLQACASTDDEKRTTSKDRHDQEAAQAPKEDQAAKDEEAAKEESRHDASTMYFPTGEKKTSSLRLQQQMPPRIRVGETFTQILTVTNISSGNLDNVVLRERLFPGFKPDQAGGVDVRDGTAEWRLGALKAGESKSLKLTGAVTESGDLKQCAWVTFEPALCAATKAVLAKLDLQMGGPREILSCEPLIYDIVVTNSGEDRLENVIVEQQLPEGLATEDGKTSLRTDAGNLDPGQSFTEKVKLAPAAKGEYEAKALASSGNVKSEASVKTTVRDPALAVEQSMEPERSAGALAHLDITVTNTGDAPSHDTFVKATLPPGAEVPRMSEGGSFKEGAAEWNLGTLAEGETRKLQMAFTSRDAGKVEVATEARGHCAKPVMARAETEFKGIPAVLLEVVDDSDPVGVGETVTYTITVTNQGSTPLTNVRVGCGIEETMEFGDSEGHTGVQETLGKALEFKPIERLEPKGKAQWKVKVKPIREADSRFQVKLRSDQIERSVEETESTHFFHVE